MHTKEIICDCGWTGTDWDLCNHWDDPDNFSYCPRCFGKNTWHEVLVASNDDLKKAKQIDDQDQMFDRIVELFGG